MIDLVLLFFAFVSIMVFASFIFTNNKMVLADQLPIAIKTFVQQNFPGRSIAYAMVDTGLVKTTYGVSLNNGVELELDGFGNWDRVDCSCGAVPAQFIPNSIGEYVKANYAGEVITRIGKQNNGFLVELSNNLYLKFSDRGMLIGFGH